MSVARNREAHPGPSLAAGPSASASAPAEPGSHPPGEPTRRRRLDERRLALSVLAVVVFVAALVAVGLDALIPFGLLLAFSTGTGEGVSRRSVILARRNVGLAAAAVVIFGWFWLWHLDLPEWMRVLMGGTLIAMPLALRESVAEVSNGRVVVVTRRSVILAIWALVVFVDLYYARGQSFNMLAGVCIVLPLVLVASRAWSARRGRIEFALLRHPLRRAVRPHLVQALNMWLCCALLGGVLAAGGVHFARVAFSLTVAQFDVMLAAFATGLVLLAALATVPLRRVHVATNVVVVLLSGFLALQLTPIARSPSSAVVLDSPLAGEWFVLNGGRSVLLNGHSPNEGNAVDFVRLGVNGRTHTGGSDAPLTGYAGFGRPVLAPADGRIIEVTDGYPDNPPGTNSDHANHLLMDIGGGRYVSMAHLKQDSVTVRPGDVVRSGQPLAAVGNNGHSNEPHLHLQVQDTAASADADRTYPIVLRNVQITRGGAWPWGESRELRTGDLVQRDEP